ncbi:MAG: hypothetical protein J6D16_02360 [Clostridia bacterium]|nr:hypothetical protein [Clostridia bacterium]
MTGFHHIFKQDYDKRIFLGDQFIFGYSEKKMRELYPEKNYTVVGEAKSARRLKKKAEAQAEAAQKKAERRIGRLHINGKEVDVFRHGEHAGLLHKREGYVCVGGDSFIAIHSSRLPFLLALLAVLLMLALISVPLVELITTPPEPPIVINPDHPLPDIDPDIETLPPEVGGDDTPGGSEGAGQTSGGFVSMVYTKEATVSLSASKAVIYYQNPNKSNHGVVLELYLVSDGQEYFLGRTGLIPAGGAIYQMDVSEREASIRAGIYTGLYRTYYYDPLTGERAAVSSDITEVKISVTE